MKTDQIVEYFRYLYNPLTIHTGGVYTGDGPIDCAHISTYNSPRDLITCISSVLCKANKNCHIFIPIDSPMDIGSLVPYPVVVSNLVAAYAPSIAMYVIASPVGSTIVLSTTKAKESVNIDILNLFDFSRFNDYMIHDSLIHKYCISPWNTVPWLSGVYNSRSIKSDGKVDVVFTIAGAESPTDNEELRIALRSIEANAKDLGNIWIATDNPPKWLAGVNIVNVSDSIKNNKDANLINKILAVCDIPEVSNRFIYWSDDQVLTGNISLRDVFPIYNSRGISDFSDDGKKWRRRMYNTLKLVQRRGCDASVNWDSHVPQPMDKHIFKSIMSSIDYMTLPGVCINTAYFGVKGETPRWSQQEFKHTYESIGCTDFKTDKLFVGYNDNGFNNGLREVLLNKFSKPSKYEKTT